MHDFDKLAEELKKHLDSSRQNWLFGAGISCMSKIPLMFPLTARVEKMLNDSGDAGNIEIYGALKADLEDSAHVEHYLSHLGDLIAVSERARHRGVHLGAKVYNGGELMKAYKAIISAIGYTVRNGYTNIGTEEIGSPAKPIVEIKHHLEFVRALFKNRANLTSRSKLTFFTTNYDTLLEDALGLERYRVIDGFSGGAVGFWNPVSEFGNTSSQPRDCTLYKLHGSVDWYRTGLNLVRARYGTTYFSDSSDIMIYPQATKYIETQKDPFSYLFSGFRKVLNSGDDNILVTCGYSFGDEHINSELEAALRSETSRTTLVIFLQETPGTGIRVNRTVDAWLSDPQIGRRVYVAGSDGVYNGSVTPVEPLPIRKLGWWTFSGLTEFISTGDV